MRKRSPYDYDPDAPLSPEEVQQEAERFTQRVGARIAELREARGYSQARVCREHDFNQSQISRIEAGKMNLTLRTACRVAAFLDVRPWELYVPREQS